MADKGYSEQSAKNILTLTRHSLGGTLTQQIGGSLKIKGYAYNPWSADSWLHIKKKSSDVITKILEYIGIIDSSNKDFANENILNISYQDNGKINGDIVSNAFTNWFSAHPETVLSIFGKNVNFYKGHFIETLNNAIENYNKILKHFKNDKITYQNLNIAYITTSIMHPKNGYKKLNDEFKKIGVYLASKNSLILLALYPNHLTNIVYGRDMPRFYALVNLNPFIIFDIDSPVYKKLEKYKNEYSYDY